MGWETLCPDKNIDFYNQFTNFSAQYSIVIANSLELVLPLRQQPPICTRLSGPPVPLLLSTEHRRTVFREFPGQRLLQVLLDWEALGVGGSHCSGAEWVRGNGNMHSNKAAGVTGGTAC